MALCLMAGGVMGWPSGKAMADRIDTVLTCVGHALRESRHNDRTILSEDLSLILRNRLGPTERAFLLACAVKSAESPDRS